MANILIIGGGVSGLSAGIYALMSGHQATICERHAVPGGNLTGWWRGEYHIDNCIHWLTGTNPNTERYKRWEEVGALGDVQVHLGESLYTCEHDGKTMSLYRDLNRVKEEMLQISPADGKEIRQFIKAVKAAQSVCGFEIGDGDGKGGALSKIAAMPALARYAMMSTGDLATKFEHPLLRRFISCLIGEDFSSIALLVVFATFCGNDGGIPQGGSLAMANRMADRFVSLGGRLLLGKKAIKINLARRRAKSVYFEDGSELPCDYVVCATDPKTSIEKLLSRPLPSAISKQYADEKMIRFSSYHTAFACKTNKLPFVGDYILSLNKKQQVELGARYLVLREFSHDKTFAPKGETVLQTMVFCGEARSRAFVEMRKTDKEGYKEQKAHLAALIEEIILAKFPKLKDKIKCIDMWTPATYNRYYGEEIGAYMSFIFPKRYLPRPAPCSVPGVRNVVLATQWQQAPGGLPTAVSMGARAIKYICRKENRKFAYKFMPPFTAKAVKRRPSH
ncbi:MAG: NAD(P)/FAD-dependent oxidoreductase [Clostridia bacterium]|nr:NAD(P)/FAD-dependent oxidoreductase [Clostridia bacterium]